MRCTLCRRNNATVGDLCRPCHNTADTRAEDTYQPDPPSDFAAGEEADRGEDAYTRAWYGTQNDGAA